MSRTRQLGIFLAIILVIACLYLGTGYLKKLNEQNALSSRLHDLAQTLSLIPVPSEDLEQQLYEAQQVYETARQGMPSSHINSTHVIRDILALAEEYQINVLPIITEQWTAKTIAGNHYDMLALTLNTRGSFDSFMNFIRRIDSNEFPSLAVDTVNITRDSEQVGGNSITATFELALFAQQ